MNATLRIKPSFAAFERFKGTFGIYAVYREGVCVYVGKATCVYSRLKGHRSRFSDCEKFEVHDLWRHVAEMDFTNTTRFLSMMEAYWIAVLKPTENDKIPDFMNMVYGAGEALQAYQKVSELTNCLPRF
jgi:excinuclease UvrABC nuclease subunit